MVNFFLRLKHWQLFLLQFVAPLFIQMVLISLTLSSAVQNQDPDSFFLFFDLFPFIMIVVLFGQMGWLWSVGVGMQEYLPKGVKMPIRTFQWFLGLACANFIAFTFFISYLVGHVQDSIETQSMPDLDLILIVPMFIITNMFSAFCLFYGFYFSGKALKSVQLQKEANFDNYAGEFFMFWFPIVGVWIMQPVINKIANGTFEPPKPQPSSNASVTKEIKDDEYDLLD